MTLDGALLLLALCSFLGVIVRHQKLRHFPLPPGPKRLPLIGNHFDIPLVKPWLTYKKWADKHGDIIFMRVPFQPTVIVSSANAAIDLMEKRSNIYSDRLVTTMDELSGWAWVFAFLPYGAKWRTRRRLFHQHFHQGAVGKYQHIETREARAFIRRLAIDNFSLENVRQTAAAVIMGVAYGITVADLNDKYVHIAHKALSTLMDIKKPGAFWVDYVPLLRHIPTWVPGATARRLGASVKPLVYAMRNEPYAAAKRDFDNGVAEFSVARRMIEDLEVRYSDSPSCYMEQEEVIKDTLGMAYAAGFDTNFISTLVFFLAMAMYPHVQRKAQAELDRVVGEERLPSFDDYQTLPYVQAIVLETLRWMPALPMGNGHRVLVDDEYKGYHIPKESLIIPNIWAMLHDSKDYPFPEDFNPDRFIADGRLNSKVRDPSTIAFGFGRRICPGRAFAKDTLFITVASTLSVFDILPALDGEGESCPLRAEQTSSFISYPESVPCVVKPRSTSAEQLIHTSA